MDKQAIGKCPYLRPACGLGEGLYRNVFSLPIDRLIVISVAYP